MGNYGRSNVKAPTAKPEGLGLVIVGLTLNCRLFAGEIHSTHYAYG
jgi:hypothetical protein